MAPAVEWEWDAALAWVALPDQAAAVSLRHPIDSARPTTSSAVAKAAVRERSWVAASPAVQASVLAALVASDQEVLAEWAKAISDDKVLQIPHLQRLFAFDHFERSLLSSSLRIQ